MKIASMPLDAPRKRNENSRSKISSTLLLLRRPLEDYEGTWGTLGIQKILTILHNNKKYEIETEVP